MKYTIVVDTDSSYDSVKNMTQVWANQRGIKVDSIQHGDQTNDEFFAVIRWAEDDVQEALARRDLPLTEKNIELVMDHSTTLEERSIEEGWEMLDVIISDLEYDNELDTSKEDKLEKESNQ